MRKNKITKAFSIEYRPDSYRLETDHSGRMHIPVKWTPWLTSLVGTGAIQVAALAHIAVAWSINGKGGRVSISRKMVHEWLGRDADRKITRMLKRLVVCGVLDSVDEVHGTHVVVTVNKDVALKVRDTTEMYVADIDFGALDYSEDCVSNAKLSTRIVMLACMSLDRTGRACGKATGSPRSREGSDTCDAAPRVALLAGVTGFSTKTIQRVFKEAGNLRLFRTEDVYKCDEDGRVRTAAKAECGGFKVVGTNRLGRIISRFNPIAAAAKGVSNLRKKAVALYYWFMRGSGDDTMVKRMDSLLDEMDGTAAFAKYRKLRATVCTLYRSVFGTDGSAALADL